MKDVTTYTTENLAQLKELSTKKPLCIYQPVAKTWFETTMQSIEDNFSAGKLTNIVVAERGPYLFINGYNR